MRFSELQAFPARLSAATELKLDLRDNPAIALFVHRCIPHERGLLKLLKAFLQTDDTFYDIGANIGYFSYLFSEQEHGLRQVVAFEPNPALAHGILNNARDRSNLHVLPIGLGAKTETAELYHDQGASDVANFRSGRSGSKTRVAVKTLDELIGQGCIPKPDVIKMDVEGYEYKVLQGYTMRDIHRPAIFAEWVEEFTTSLGSGFDDLKALLGPRWEIFRVENDGTLRNERIHAANTTNDILLVHRDSKYHPLAERLCSRT